MKGGRLIRIATLSLFWFLTGEATGADLPVVAPETVIAKYGKPDKIDSTEFDKPRPPFVTKWLIYRKERVQFMFLADGPVGSPPPYKQWRLMGMQDPNTKAVLRAEEVEKRLAGRGSKK